MKVFGGCKFKVGQSLGGHSLPPVISVYKNQLVVFAGSVTRPPDSDSLGVWMQFRRLYLSAYYLTPALISPCPPIKPKGELISMQARVLLISMKACVFYCLAIPRHSLVDLCCECISSTRTVVFWAAIAHVSIN